MMNEQERNLKIIKALADNTRFAVFQLLKNGTLCACKILEKLEISQPTLSHHMKVLCDTGLVKAEKDWKWTYYSINCDVLSSFVESLNDTKCRRK